MARLMESIEINAPSREVCQYLWEADNLPDYLPASRVEILEGTEKRVKLRYDLSVSGKPMELVCVHELSEPGRKIRFRTVEGMKLEGTWLLQQLRGGTKVTYMMTYEPPGGILGAVLGKLKMKKEMERICAGALQKIKAVHEA